MLESTSNHQAVSICYYKVKVMVSFYMAQYPVFMIALLAERSYHFIPCRNL